MKKNLTKEWKQLNADTMEFLELFGERIIKTSPKSYCGVSIRNHKGGYTLRHEICSFNGRGVYYFDSKRERKFVKWSKVREWDLFHFLEIELNKNKQAASLRKRYDDLCDATRESFGKHVEANGGGYYDGKLQLRFVIEERLMKLHRTGSWGVMLEDKNGELYEDDFTGLDMGSRCKLVEFLAA